MGEELEQKYVVASQRPWLVQSRLLSRLSRAGCQVTFSGEEPQRDTYFDTPGDGLLREGVSLRLRERGGKKRLTVKGPRQGAEGVFLRREDELALEAGCDPAAFLAERLPGTAVGDLRPTAVVVNRRRTYEVSRLSGGRFELAFDDVTYQNPATGREYRERQVELEALSGTREALERLAGLLRLPELRPADGSKYERARRLTAKTAE